jgi:cytochrome c
MKTLILFISLITIFATINCGNKSSKNENDNNTEKPVNMQQMMAFKEGLALVENSDCGTCHKRETKHTGPSYIDISNKYNNTEDNINLLANKIIKGGSGVWGQIPMLPHDKITVTDAQKMVKYIFAIKEM